MRTVSKYLFTVLLGTAIVSSCSRPVAYFQPSARENFKFTQSQSVAVATPVEAVQSVAIEPQVVQARQVVDQVEAYVRNDNKLSLNKKLAKRIVRLNAMLANTSNKTLVSTNTAPAKKMSFMERAMLKKIDKQIKNHVAPDQQKATNSRVLRGAIIGVVGLLFLLFGGGGILALLGGIAFVIGIVLVLTGVLNV